MSKNNDGVSGNDLSLCSLQFAFLAFLCSQSLEGFYQWKRMLELLLSCEEYPLHHRRGPDVYCHLLEAISVRALHLNNRACHNLVDYKFANLSQFSILQVGQ